MEELLKTLGRIKACYPAPAEIMVHVDGGNVSIVAALQEHHPDIKVITSDVLLGPGGSRNRLVIAASHELVANFDDDSFPDQEDYFTRVMQTAERFPDAAIISASSQEAERRISGHHAIAVASGCGCVFRKSWFLRTQGFVPLPIAYGMEEVDISLQLHALGGVIVHDPSLHVKHDKLPPTEVSAELNAAVIANFALFPYLRYPPLFWVVGLWQVGRRCLYVMSSGWGGGAWRGLKLIPQHLVSHRRHIAPVSARALMSWFRLRSFPRLLSPASLG